MQKSSETAFLQSCPQALSTAGHNAGALHIVVHGLQKVDRETSVRRQRDYNKPKQPCLLLRQQAKDATEFQDNWLKSHFVDNCS